MLKDIFQNPAKYNKFWVALSGGALMILGRHMGLDSVYYQDAVTVATVIGVIFTPNK